MKVVYVVLHYVSDYEGGYILYNIGNVYTNEDDAKIAVDTLNRTKGGFSSSYYEYKDKFVI